MRSREFDLDLSLRGDMLQADSTITHLPRFPQSSRKSALLQTAA
jgi:hypothetical protein